MRRILTLLVLLAPAVLHASEAGLATPVREACIAALPEELVETAGVEGALTGSSPAGEWRVESGEMDGTGGPEALLVILPAGRKGEVRFFAERDDGVVEEKVKLKRAFQRASVRFEPFAEGRELAHVDAGPGGQVLLHWDGKKLSTVWKVGHASGERRWFEVEDLDEDGVSEVVVYFQREIDVFYADEDDLTDGAAGGETLEVDPVAVYRFDGGRWRKAKDLLERLR